MSTLSVIICTYNRAHLLRRTLRSLSRQTLAPDQFELIVVDDGSRDDTSNVCAAMGSELPNLKYIFTGKNMGLAGARNVGVRGSSGDYILFTDDDCVPKKDWVERLSAVLNREPIAAGAVESPVSNYFKLCHNISQFHAYMPGRDAGYTEMLAGANMAFHRSILEELNGFQEHLKCAEDTEFILRARSRGYRPFFEPGAVVTHDPERTTLGDIFHYSSNHAAATILLRNQYQSLLNTPFVLRSPALLIATSPIIALKVTADIYLRNFDLAKHVVTSPVIFGLKLAWCFGAARGLRNYYKTAGEKWATG